MLLSPVYSKIFSRPVIILLLCFFQVLPCSAQKSSTQFNVIAFYTGRNDLAHISFVHEANKWFPAMAAKYNFHYDSTNDWSNMNSSFLSKYQVVVFLDTRPDSLWQRN